MESIFKEVIYIKKLIILIIIFAILIGSTLFIYEKLKPNEYVLPPTEDLYLIIEDKIIDEGWPVIYEDGILYFSFDTIKSYIDDNIFYDEDEEMVIFTNKEMVKRYKIYETEASVNSKTFNIEDVIKRFDDNIYIPLGLFSNDYDIDVNYYEETNAVVMDYHDMYYLTGEIINSDASIRSDYNIKAPILINNLEIGKEVFVYEEFEKWYKVRTLDGIIGFIEKKYIKLNHVKEIYKTQLIDRSIATGNKLRKINLTWDYTYGKVTNTSNIVSIPGVNTISPTWFSVIDEEGKIYDKGNNDYVTKYKKLGYEIWPIFDNSFDPDMTHEFLKSSNKRENIINELLNIYLNYGFHGINIDFENVYLKDRDLLTQFVRELYPLFKENDMTVSMDVTAVSTNENWSVSFDRIRLQDTTDYLVLMAYDQHWASSPVAGSVAEYAWVERSLLRIFDFIPREKLILAVPFYSRLWTIEDEKVSSQALTMEVANRFINNNNIDMSWDDYAGQYYGELEKDNKLYKIWLEDARSLEYKASLIHKYNLAGVASWRKGFESPDIWLSLERVLN